MERKRILSKLLRIGLTSLLLILILTIWAYYFPETMRAWIYFPLVGILMVLGVGFVSRGVDALNKSEQGREG